MRVLILVHGYPPAHTGGAERRAARTAQQLSQRGHDVMVVAIQGVSDTLNGDSFTERLEQGVRVRRLTLLADRSPDAFRTSYDNPQTAAATEQAILDFKPDVVHLFSGYLMSASAPRVAFQYGIPVVVSLTDYWWLCHRITLIRTNQQRCSGPSATGCARCQAESMRRYRVPLRYAPALTEALWTSAGRHARLGARVGLLEQVTRQSHLVALLNECSALISPSRFLADFYVQHGVDASRMHVWRQGVDVDSCLRRTASGTLRFGVLGQVKAHKGVDLILDAWKQLQGEHPRHLYIYGSAHGELEYGQKIRSIVDELDDVSWPGEYAGDEVWDILKDLDVLIVPSRWVENSPNSILEAQAMGVPVIASNLGAMPEMVMHGQNGLVFEADDAQDLSRQMQRLLDDPGLVDELRTNPLPFKTVDGEIDELCDLYAELVVAPNGCHLDRSGEISAPANTH